MSDAAEIAKHKREVRSKASRAGLTFAVSRVENRLRHSKLADKLGSKAYIYLTGVVEAVIKKALEDAGTHASSLTPPAKRLTAIHVKSAVRSNPDFARTFGDFCFTSDLACPKASECIIAKDPPPNKRAPKASPDDGSGGEAEELDA